MKGIAGSLDETAAKNIAAYYHSLTPEAPKVRKPLTVAQWAERCDRCHGPNGNSVDPRHPALAGQRVEYLRQVLNAYRTGERHSPEMAAMSAELTEGDIDRLAAYYAHQKTRAVVFVTLPTEK